MISTEALDFAVNIAAVERETGLSKDTLRVWERRYGFPQPLRDANDERVYPIEQVEKLRIIRRLMDQGLRPGKIVAMPLEELVACLGAEGVPAGTGADYRVEVEEVLALIRKHQAIALREHLGMALLRLGLKQFVIEVVAQLNVAVGLEWAQGRIAIFEEHLYTEQIQHLLRHAIGSMPQASGRPRVLLTTLPGEEHQIGLLMAHACMAVEGVQCISLGVQTPAREIVHAARAHSADVVGLSFSEVMKLNQATKAIKELRAQLDPNVDLWAGGALWKRARQPLEGVRTIASLDDVSKTLDQWREGQEK